MYCSTLICPKHVRIDPRGDGGPNAVAEAKIFSPRQNKERYQRRVTWRVILNTNN